jgi:hypothetical protein
VDVAGTSLAVGSDDFGLIAFGDFSASFRDLWVAHCENLHCTSTTVSQIDQGSMVNSWVSLAIGSDGLGLISYRDENGGALKVAHCSNVECSSATLTTIDTGVGVEYSSVAIGNDGLGLIAYFDGVNEDLKVAHCENLVCSSATVTTVESAGQVGAGSVVVIGADGLGIIAYFRSSAFSARRPRSRAH